MVRKRSKSNHLETKKSMYSNYSPSTVALSSSDGSGLEFKVLNIKEASQEGIQTFRKIGKINNGNICQVKEIRQEKDHTMLYIENLPPSYISLDSYVKLARKISEKDASIIMQQLCKICNELEEHKIGWNPRVWNLKIDPRTLHLKVSGIEKDLLMETKDSGCSSERYIILEVVNLLLFGSSGLNEENSKSLLSSRALNFCSLVKKRSKSIDFRSAEDLLANEWVKFVNFNNKTTNLKELQAKNIFESLDIDRKGYISKPELLDYFSKDENISCFLRKNIKVLNSKVSFSDFKNVCSILNNLEGDTGKPDSIQDSYFEENDCKEIDSSLSSI